jgi:hypothetical protein
MNRSIFIFGNSWAFVHVSSSTLLVCSSSNSNDEYLALMSSVFQIAAYGHRFVQASRSTWGQFKALSGMATVCPEPSPSHSSNPMAELSVKSSQMRMQAGLDDGAGELKLLDKLLGQ